MTAAQSYDPFLFALALWREARGESLAAKVGVASVIKNRMADPQKRWPASIGGVILQPRQFSSFSSGDPNAAKFPVSTDPAWLECCRVVDSVSESAEDPTAGANFYHSLPTSIIWPAWAEQTKQTAVIGPFRFYKR